MNYEKVAVMFQNRIAEITSRYEGDIAVMRIQYEEEIEKLQKQVQSLSGDKQTDVVE